MSLKDEQSIAINMARNWTDETTRARLDDKIASYLVQGFNYSEACRIVYAAEVGYAMALVKTMLVAFAPADTDPSPAGTPRPLLTVAR
jgi:hypothetical protein